MKLLFSSHDLKAVESLVKRLLVACIPCAVCKDRFSSTLAVWIQQDTDLALALTLLVHRPAPPPLPHWAELLDPELHPPRRPATPAGNATATQSSAARGRMTKTIVTLSRPRRSKEKPERRPLLRYSNAPFFRSPACPILPNQFVHPPPGQMATPLELTEEVTFK